MHSQLHSHLIICNSRADMQSISWSPMVDHQDSSQQDLPFNISMLYIVYIVNVYIAISILRLPLYRNTQKRQPLVLWQALEVSGFCTIHSILKKAKAT